MLNLNYKKKYIGLLGYKKYYKNLYHMKYDIYQTKFNDGYHVNQNDNTQEKKRYCV